MRFATYFRWEVTESNRSAFQVAWAEVTDLLKVHGSLGSALFETPDGLLCAFARWPDRATRDAAFAKLDGHPASAKLAAVGGRSVERVDMDVLDDRWVWP